MKFTSLFTYLGIAAVALAAEPATSTNAVPAAAETKLPELEQFALVDGLLASVNGDQITLSEVVAETTRFIYPKLAKQYKGKYSQNEIFKMAFREGLTQIENRRLVLQEYWKGDQRIPPYAIDKYCASILDDRYGGDMTKLQADLAENKMTYSEWKAELEKDIIVQSMRTSYVEAHVQVSPNDIRKAYEERAKAEAWTVDEKVHAHLIEIDATDTATLMKVAELLRGNTSFADIAKQYSLDPLAAKGGDYGFVVLDDEFSTPIAAAFKKMKDGEIVGPVEIDASISHKFYLYREASEAGRVREITEVWDEVERKLRNEQREEIFARWIEHLRSRASIKEFIPKELLSAE